MCNCKNSCVTFALIVSLLVGIVTAFLRITSTITLTPAFLWVLFGIAVVYLGVILFAALIAPNCQPCAFKDSVIYALLVGILGTVLLSVVLLAITYVATSVIGAILSGLLLFSFSLTVTASACVVLNCL